MDVDPTIDPMEDWRVGGWCVGGWCVGGWRVGGCSVILTISYF